MTFPRLCFLAMAMVAFAAGPSHALTDQEEMVQKANITVQKVLQSKDIGDRVADMLRKAKGVLIFPNLYKGALFFGGVYLISVLFSCPMFFDGYG